MNQPQADAQHAEQRRAEREGPGGADRHQHGAADRRADEARGVEDHRVHAERRGQELAADEIVDHGHARGPAEGDDDAADDAAEAGDRDDDDDDKDDNNEDDDEDVVMARASSSVSNVTGIEPIRRLSGSGES